MPHDVSTQWNLSCDMVEFAVEHHEPINVITQQRDLGLRKFKLSDREWATLKELQGVLMVSTHKHLKVTYIINKIKQNHTVIERCYSVLLTWKPQSCNGDPCDGSHRPGIYNLCTGHNVLVTTMSNSGSYLVTLVTSQYFSPTPVAHSYSGHSRTDILPLSTTLSRP